MLDGRAMAIDWRAEIRSHVDHIVKYGGRPPGLAVVLVGNRPDSVLYVQRKREAAEEVGFDFRLEHMRANVSQTEVVETVKSLCRDPHVDGVLVQLPLPPRIDETAVMEAFDPRKDVDGFHPVNVGRLVMRGQEVLHAPCTPRGCIEMLRRAGVSVKGKHAVVLGDSNIVGLPLSMMLRDEGAAAVTVCHRPEPVLPAVPTWPPEIKLKPDADDEKTEADRDRSPTTRDPRNGATPSNSYNSSVNPPSRHGPLQAAYVRAQADACLPRTPIKPKADPSLRRAHPGPGVGANPVLLQNLPTTLSQVVASEHPDFQMWEGLPDMTAQADILVVAVGEPELVSAAWVKPGAVVLDVGINVVDVPRGETRTQTQTQMQRERGGDKDRDSTGVEANALLDGQDVRVVGDVHYESVSRVASMISPVPGGVGPMTIAALLANTLESAKASMGLCDTY
jgi:5,10-methylene-tetrahydrofolate dehydrogenase/methenyl tetrahydrofolate cyclohydrolase